MKVSIFDGVGTIAMLSMISMVLGRREWKMRYKQKVHTIGIVFQIDRPKVVN